jgi:hypothetical protein
VKQDLKLGMHAGVRYRTVSEASILDMCHLAGWACESGEGSPGRGRTREALEHRIALGLGVRRGAAGERSDSGEVGATGQNPRRGHRAEPPTEGGWFLVGVFRALDTAKRRQVQATRSRIVPGTFVGRAA